MFSAPSSTASAASSRATRVESCFAGGWSRLIFEPARVFTPAMSKRFYTAKRHAGERAKGFAPRAPGIHFGCFFPRTLGCHVRIGHELRVQRGDPREMRFGDRQG